MSEFPTTIDEYLKSDEKPEPKGLLKLVDPDSPDARAGAERHNKKINKRKTKRDIKKTGVTGIELDSAADPLHDADSELEQVDTVLLDLPCFLVRDDLFEMGGSKRKAGVWYCHLSEKDCEFKALWICSPLYIDGLTNTEDGQLFGRLLRFRDSRGRWRVWAMPMGMLRGSCEELRGGLLDSGVEINYRNRLLLGDYLQWRTPKTIITAATKTGWTQGNAFVLRDRVIGADDVFFPERKPAIRRRGSNRRQL